MREYEVKTLVRSYSWDELSQEQQELLTIAKQQTQHAYCPYSHYHVGAAARLENGVIVVGANQENAAYPSGLCAERAALFAAGAQYPKEPVLQLAIACYTQGNFTELTASPCGACRQVMVETEHRYGKPMEILLYGEKEICVFRSAADLLPLTFVSESLSGK
ncbi:MAG: cytidine deaminase [Paludibacteraceae bacterium]